MNLTERQYARLFPIRGVPHGVNFQDVLFECPRCFALIATFSYGEHMHHHDPAIDADGLQSDLDLMLHEKRKAAEERRRSGRRK